MTCRWLIALVSSCPLKDRVVGLWDPFQMAIFYIFLSLTNGGDPNHLLTGMSAQVNAPHQKWPLL